ncbi:hypothetical protein GLOTRDRAFT_132539 [Gloeophyllum trabeum ATCC 11539]|uniref:Uncharacterized protein n=1 Tax=Gloeophyllum trabeum (strain ATCC 11539 / FP-39264 / Madison 617) TaxID=670483 RepID=S7RBU2_GLOTA|nr:uncharacterized protein GLOTRDRAFT_132539 [Gloeophyllum trabeum ATCC 11539]EPQ51720.1 hypothetical protein GLOTRDRAFT_132539 [Gloeophyllum trabeum ATCC 11539]
MSSILDTMLPHTSDLASSDRPEVRALLDEGISADEINAMGVDLVCRLRQCMRPTWIPFHDVADMVAHWRTHLSHRQEFEIYREWDWEVVFDEDSENKGKRRAATPGPSEEVVRPTNRSRPNIHTTNFVSPRPVRVRRMDWLHGPLRSSPRPLPGPAHPPQSVRRSLQMTPLFQISQAATPPTASHHHAAWSYHHISGTDILSGNSWTSSLDNNYRSLLGRPSAVHEDLGALEQDFRAPSPPSIQENFTNGAQPALSVTDFVELFNRGFYQLDFLDSGNAPDSELRADVASTRYMLGTAGPAELSFTGGINLDDPAPVMEPCVLVPPLQPATEDLGLPASAAPTHGTIRFNEVMAPAAGELDRLESLLLLATDLERNFEGIDGPLDQPPTYEPELHSTSVSLLQNSNDYVVNKASHDSDAAGPLAIDPLQTLLTSADTPCSSDISSGHGYWVSSSPEEGSLLETSIPISKYSSLHGWDGSMGSDQTSDTR